MELAPSDTLLSFEVTFDSTGLDVAMSVYDVTSGSAVLVQGPTAMILVAGYTYQGHFTGTLDHNYVILKAVYTDNTFATFDLDYAQGSESIVVQDIGGGGGSSASTACAVVGYVIENENLIGFVNC